MASRGCAFDPTRELKEDYDRACSVLNPGISETGVPRRFDRSAQLHVGASCGWGDPLFRTQSRVRYSVSFRCCYLGSRKAASSEIVSLNQLDMDRNA